MSGDAFAQDNFTIDVSAIPRTTVNGGTVRFFPVILKDEIYDSSFVVRQSTCADAKYWLYMASNPFLYTGAMGRIVEFYSTGTLPSGLVANKPYYVVEIGFFHTTCWSDYEGDIRVSETPGGAALDITDAGTGTHYMRRYRARPLCGYGATPAFLWDFGDGSATSELATPTHTYDDATGKTTYDVSLTICDSNNVVKTITKESFITVDVDDNLPEYVASGSFLVTVVIKRPTYDQYHVPTYDYIIISRNGNNSCNLKLQKVVSTDSMDVIGTLKFSVLNDGTFAESNPGWITEGNFVEVFLGQELTFSGLIRRVTTNTQAGHNSQNVVEVLDVECDSHHAFLKQFPVDVWALASAGQNIVDSPGLLLRRIMYPTTLDWVVQVGDYRGIINCIDANTSYKLNSSSASEQAGSQYQHIMALHELTNYDLRIREIYSVFRYSYLDDEGGGGVY